MPKLTAEFGEILKYLTEVFLTTVTLVWQSSHTGRDQLATRPTYIISSTTIYQHARCDHRTNCCLLYLCGASIVSENVQR